MFPATVRNSYTLGGGYAINKGLDLEGAFVLSPEVKTTVDISDATASAPGTLYNTTKHSQKSYAVSLRYKY